MNMLFEHVAINVPDSKSMADWYVEHCGMKIVIEINEPPYTRFLTDNRGVTCIEIYQNQAAPIPDYSNQNPLVYHHAFAVENLEATREYLEKAGASFVEEVIPAPGTRLLMLRDPWGIPLQLVNRKENWYSDLKP